MQDPLQSSLRRKAYFTHLNQQYIPKHPQFMPSRAHIRAFEAIVFPFKLRVYRFLGGRWEVGEGDAAGP